MHKMRLINDAFERMKKGIKTVEIRLYDEKRQLIKPGDIIEFTNLDTGELLRVKVIKLHLFDSFKELFDHFDKKAFGINESTTYKSMDRFYTKEEQEKYKAVGIEIKLIEE